MRSKHPAAHPETTLPSPPDHDDLEGVLSVNECDIRQAIRSFPKGSAGGPDCLRPQHLLDLTSSTAGPGGVSLLRSLTAFTNLVLSGNTPVIVRPFLFGASLVALKKRDGGLRPIAVGCTFRRLAAKCASMAVMERMGALLSPVQLGYGTPLGAEAAAHSARRYLANLHPDHVILKLDFKNAFNSIRRDKMLEAVKLHTPELFPFIYSCYSTSSSLYFHDTIISSAEGVQQGDPLGPLLFCLVIFPLTHSEFRIFYLDDATLGGNEADVCDDFKMIEREAAAVGLELNHHKSELICADQAGLALLHLAPDLCRVRPNTATMLGSPIGSSVDEALLDKVETLRKMKSRLSLLSSQDALILLRHSFAIPKILYILRTAPCFSSPCLAVYDAELRSTLSEVLNITFSCESVWSQATLPVCFGGIGVRRASQLAPSAFLASAAGSCNLINQILPARFSGIPYTAVDAAVTQWREGHNYPPPVSPSSSRQKAWDLPHVEETYDQLLQGASDCRSRARLLAAATKESGAWLHALPVSSLGLRMDDHTTRIAVGLRLGTPLCQPHICHHCGGHVDALATHGLSCIKSQGRFSRHVAINAIIHRSLAAINVPSTLEPIGLCRSDGKRPDGCSIAPWKSGQCLVWDFTCVDTFAASYMSDATREARAVATAAEARKREKYALLSKSHHFVPVAIETSGALGPDALSLLTDISRRQQSITHDHQSLPFLLQRVSIALQQGNAASVMGTTSSV